MAGVTGAVGAILAAAGASNAPSPAFIAATAHNVVEIVPGGFVGPPVLKHGALGNSTGGRQTDSTKPQRLSVFLAPGATLRGIVLDVLKRTQLAGHGPTTDAERTSAVQGVYVYNHTYLEALPASAWQVGLWMPLPVEIDGSGTWTTDWDAMVTLGASFDVTKFLALESTPTPLPIPDPDTLVTDVGTFLAGKDTAATAGSLVTQAVANPFECVFRLYEVFRQLPDAGTRNKTNVALALIAGLTDRELAQLARVTAGNAILRRLWTAVRTTPGAPQDRVATALGLGGAVGAWQDPTTTGPTVVPQELPLRPATPPGPRFESINPKVANPNPAGEDPRGEHTLVMGRDLCVGNRVTGPKQAGGFVWRGVGYFGRVSPKDWAAAHTAALNLSSMMEKARLDVVVKIAPNEGNIDASRAADKGTLSSGFQQWSIHTNTELPALLERFRVAAPDHYDLFFGIYGVQPRLWARSSGGGEASGTPADADIRAANPDAFTGVTPNADPKTYNVGYATVGSLAPGGPWSRLPEPPETVTALNPRHQFFGATQPPGAGKVFEIASHWCARVRLAELCSTDHRLCQTWKAVYRFDRLARTIGTLTVDGVTYPPKELLTSQFAAAVALDQHINNPGKVHASLDRAVQNLEDARSVADPAAQLLMRPHAPPSPASPHPALQEPWSQAMVVDYLKTRTMVSTQERDRRNAMLLALHDTDLKKSPPTGFSALPGSFLGWPP